MWTKILVYVSTLFIAFAILFASVLRTASVKYEVCSTSTNQSFDSSDGNANIDYFLPFPGRVLPDSPFWPLKALRDKIWLSITTSSTRRVELKLLFADKRLGSSQLLFQKGKAENALSTLTKAEKYLEEASLDEEAVRRKGTDTTELLYRLTKSSLKHYQVMQKLLETVPYEVKPFISKLQEYPKKSFERGRNGLLEKGEIPPENPFEW
ncbi:hypothetical protein A2Z67_01370 [Candidatus Woesebacteria bacterium RBG_13_36_22]|uniref:DUF5667 domain-containing protein n=1 Tax=Candidatus Woesebacteria bacterium RBG_13_36_22 TaxID=1802478 RepID=A0A1F7X171_9BACT|nr:MAG: hypothetical protein A2Z67_01370 [Candidatus Woesebacteria bacterium RBG_13_36_22]